MTPRIEKIFDDYRRSDFMARLHIYLQYPELRNDFLEIDQKESTTDDLWSPKHTNNRCSGIGDFFNRSVSFLLG